MGEVFLKYRIMPDGVEVDLESLQASLKAALPGFAKMEKCEIKPFAFGMKCLETGFTIEDEDGNNDKLEEAITGVDGIQGLELLDMGRI